MILVYNNRMTYSHDLRIKALGYIENGGSKAKASQIFGVTTQTLFNWINRKREENLPPKRTRERSPYKIEEEKFKDYIKANPDSYLREIAQEFGVATSTVFYACKRLKITLKKRHHSTRKGMKKRDPSSKKN